MFNWPLGFGVHAYAVWWRKRQLLPSSGHLASLFRWPLRLGPAAAFMPSAWPLRYLPLRCAAWVHPVGGAFGHALRPTTIPNHHPCATRLNQAHPPPVMASPALAGAAGLTAFGLGNQGWLSAVKRSGCEAISLVREAKKIGEPMVWWWRQVLEQRS